ncbi:MAG: hypothetical protein KGZ65_09420 [Sphingomonadales bacterium]|nr:hypothetical protein [Sphingomonadaceae bacterium]MBS3931442.1 hypothetical protein [Sphingomonadales bacterium]
MTYILFAAAYCLFVVAVGAYFGRSSSSHLSDYYLAERGAKRWIGAFAASASSESAWVLMGLVGAAYTSGLSVLWLIPGCVLGYAFNWFAVAPRLHHLTDESKAVTLAEAIGFRHNSARLRIVLTAIIVIFITAYLSSQFLAIGRVVNSTTSLTVPVGIIAGAVFVLAYVGYGGMRASLVTDFLQAILMVGVLVLLPAYGVYRVVSGGLSFDVLPADFMSLTGGKSGFALVGLILGWAGIGLAYPGQPHVLQRHMTMRDDREIRFAGPIAITWSALVFGGAILSGVVGRLLVENPADKELVMLYLGQLTNSPAVGGIVIAAIFAAIASTADSQLLALSASIKNDIPHVKASERIGPRMLTVALALLGAVIAGSQNTSIFALVLFAWEFLGVTIGIAVIGTLIMQRSASAIMVSMAVGAVTLLFWRNMEALNGALYALVPAMILAIVTLYASKFVGQSK